MRDVLGPGTVLGYCTNVHPGASWPEVRTNLEDVSLRVKRIVSPDSPLGLGLWFSAASAEGVNWIEAAEWLHACGLLGFTLNAFPYADFHQPIVKHAVYEPGWDRPERREYTQRLVAGWSAIRVRERLDALSISTAPIGWPGRADVAAAAEQIRGLAQHLAMLEKKVGLLVTVDLEPEPGCILDTADDVVAFFDKHLPDEVHRRHIGVCHDVCHAAIMFEDQEAVLRQYADAGIRVNKVQISNAPRIPEGAGSASRAAKDGALDGLRRFVEPRYLHQTSVKTGADRWFFEDLPDALAALDDPREPIGLGSGEWRVHFHVPVFLDAIGPLSTTQDQIMPAIMAARELHDCKHFEVETYAWGVLPDELRVDDLAEGIARELLWVKAQAEAAGLGGAG